MKESAKRLQVDEELYLLEGYSAKAEKQWTGVGRANPVQHVVWEWYSPMQSIYFPNKEDYTDYTYSNGLLMLPYQKIWRFQGDTTALCWSLEYKTPSSWCHAFYFVLALAMGLSAAIMDVTKTFSAEKDAKLHHGVGHLVLLLFLFAAFD